jgi:uncharacterized alkaline shock family protein YloU
MQIDVFALIGKRGTGKSHHAPLLAYQYSIEHIIDDGLLIKGNQILAGRSAKRENTRYGAIKRALFNDPDHARQLQKKLVELGPERVLILATSSRMADAIAGKLGLPRPVQYITIEDISSPEEIQRAMQVREKENRHVIPLPTFAVKKEFPGYLVDPLRSFFRFPATQPQKVAVERSIIRPVYSTLGNFYIAEHVVGDLVDQIVAQIPGIHKTHKVEVKTLQKKVVLNVELVLDLEQPPGKNLVRTLEQAQQDVKEQLEYLTGFYLDRVNITAKKIHLGGEFRGVASLDPVFAE